MPKRNGRKPLVREGEPTQRTDQDLEIPVPERDEVMGLFGKAATKRGKSSRSAKGKRRTSRDDQ